MARPEHRAEDGIETRAGAAAAARLRDARKGVGEAHFSVSVGPGQSARAIVFYPEEPPLPSSGAPLVLIGHGALSHARSIYVLFQARV